MRSNEELNFYRVNHGHLTIRMHLGIDDVCIGLKHCYCKVLLSIINFEFC